MRPARRSFRARCLVPGFDGAFLSHDSKDALWDKFYTAAPTTTEAVRRAIQNSQESLRALAKRYRDQPEDSREVEGARDCRRYPDRPQGSQIDGAFHRGGGSHRRFPAAYATCRSMIASMRSSPTIPHLTRSSLHRCLQRHGISRLPEVEGQQAFEEKVQGLSDRLLPQSTSLSSRPLKASSTSMSLLIAPASSPSCNWSGRREGPQPRPSSKALIAAVPYKIHHTVLTDNGIQFTSPTALRGNVFQT